MNKLDVGLGWEPGSAMRVLAGGDPTPNNNASGLGRGLASLIPTKSGATPDDEPNVDIAYPPPRPRTSREEWARKGQQLAQAVPMASYDDALKRRREAAEKALKKTFPGSTEPPAEMLRMMRELLEERELETLAERIEKLSRPLQLDVSSYVDDLLTLYGERQGPADDIDPLADLDPDFWPAAARKEDDPKEDDGVE
ncbi:hypothetical protein [Mycolicibacterium fortuitum]|uniref:hypothetical protein n=1 Tax=Mycolicibacterium fortuitum TaxID=1766 RepID=UPI00262EB572|nr:hypothetical protein [Mycolicibacterium fortuitum]